MLGHLLYLRVVDLCLICCLRGFCHCYSLSSESNPMILFLADLLSMYLCISLPLRSTPCFEKNQRNTKLRVYVEPKNSYITDKHQQALQLFLHRVAMVWRKSQLSQVLCQVFSKASPKWGEWPSDRLA